MRVNICLTLIVINQLQQITETLLGANKDSAAIQFPNAIVFDGNIAGRLVVVAYRQSIRHFIWNRKNLSCKQKHVRQLSRLAYIPTCRSPSLARLWPWPIPLKVIRSESHGSNTIILAVLDILPRHKVWPWFLTPQGHPRSILTVPIKSAWILRMSAPGVQPRILPLFFRYLESKFWRWPFDLGRANPWATKHGRWPATYLGLPSCKISARLRKWSTRCVSPKFFFTFWPWGLTPGPKFTKGEMTCYPTFIAPHQPTMEISITKILRTNTQTQKQ